MTKAGRCVVPFESSALLDAVPDATAVLDHDGTIVATNHAWRMFAADNGGDAESTGVGVNYLAVCERAAAAGCEEADGVVAAIRDVASGDVVESDLEYACPSPAVGRWFLLRVTRIAGAEPGVLISHVNISRRKAAESDLAALASQDVLTGLANRTLFAHRLAAALAVRPERRRDGLVGVVYIDLDGFKLVNDTYGHAAGDEVLQTVAARLTRATRPEDTVARLGGDEFAVVMPHVNAAELALVAARIEGSLAAPHLVHGNLLHVLGSVGTHLADHGETPAASLGRADDAMYVAKRARAV